MISREETKERGAVVRCRRAAKKNGWAEIQKIGHISLRNEAPAWSSSKNTFP